MQVVVKPCQGMQFLADLLKDDYPVLFTVGAGRNSSPWY